MHHDLVAQTATTIAAPREAVWNALVDPAAIKQYMFGTTVTSEWKEGASICWKGEWQGKPYEDKGKILELTPNRTLRYTHFSPLAGKPDRPENYHTVTVELSDDTGGTRVELFQDNNSSERAREHSEKNWTGMLASLKKLLEE
jgi:uncharacterized protein YndB with AHSA1/START domain